VSAALRDGHARIRDRPAAIEPQAHSGENPTVDAVFSMLRTMGYRLRLVPTRPRAKAARRERSQSELRRAWLARLGAPLYGKSLVEGRRQPEPEAVLSRALALAHEDATVARALPVVIMRQRHSLDLNELRRRARRANQTRTLGFFLDLTTRLIGDSDLKSAAESPRSKHMPVTDFFKVRADPRRANTPEVARDWGYRLNMGMDSFESLLVGRRSDKRVEVLALEMGKSFTRRKPRRRSSRRVGGASMPRCPDRARREGRALSIIFAKQSWSSPPGRHRRG
jgi:hypothetical protein